MTPSPGVRPIPADAKVGDVLEHGNPLTSKVEQQVAAALVSAGHEVPDHRVSVVVRHPDGRHRHMTLTPDVALVTHRIDVEVDPCDEAPARGYTHRGAEDRDASRNALMAEAGWSVIRLRLGAVEGMHIGPRDVVVESASFTRAAAQALLEAVADAVAGRPERVRLVPKGRTPAAARRRSHVVNLGEYRYADDGHIFTWYPDLDADVSRKLRLSMGGRYLYAHDSPDGFLAEPGLHEVPPAEWKTRLTELLRDGRFTASGWKWPWGPTLLQPAPAAPPHDVIEACERKASIDDALVDFTVSGADLARWNHEGLYTDAQEPIATLHPDAVAAGYRVDGVESLHGRHGPYQRVRIIRPPG